MLWTCLYNINSVFTGVARRYMQIICIYMFVIWKYTFYSNACNFCFVIFKQKRPVDAGPRNLTWTVVFVAYERGLLVSKKWVGSRMRWLCIELVPTSGRQSVVFGGSGWPTTYIHVDIVLCLFSTCICSL